MPAGQLEYEPRFAKRMESARASLRASNGPEDEGPEVLEAPRKVRVDAGVGLICPSAVFRSLDALPPVDQT